MPVPEGCFTRIAVFPVLILIPFWNQCADRNSSRVLPRPVESVGGVVSPEAKKRRRAFLAFRCDRVRSHCASRHHSVLPKRSALQDFVECEEGGKRFGRPPRSSRACVWHCVSSYEHLSSLLASSTPTFLKHLAFFHTKRFGVDGGALSSWRDALLQQSEGSRDASGNSGYSDTILPKMRGD